MPAVDLTPPLICDPMDLPVAQPLPTGVNFDVALPGIGEVFSARLCCKVFQLPLGLTPPIALGFGAVLPLAILVNDLIGQVNAFIRTLAMTCPRE